MSNKVADFLVKASEFVNGVAEGLDPEQQKVRVAEAKEFLSDLSESLDGLARQAGAYDLGDLLGERRPKADWSAFTDMVQKAAREATQEAQRGWRGTAEKTEKPTNPSREDMFDWLIANDKNNNWDRAVLRNFYLRPENEHLLKDAYNRAQASQGL